MKTLCAIFLCLLFNNSFAATKCNAEKRHKAYRSANVSKCAHDKNRLKCLQIREVIDGDTLSVNISGVHPYFGQDASVRLFGLDTPESRPPTVECIPTVAADSELDKEEYETCLEAKRLRKCEVEASNEATSLLSKAICEDSDRVDIEIARDANGELIREKYGRILGNIFIIKKIGSGQSTVVARDLLLKEQLAFTYDGGTKRTRDWCRKTLVKDSRLQSAYVKSNFCSSRKCTEKTRQVRCYRRASYGEQIECYSERVGSNIGRWFNSCKTKSGPKRRGCYREKSENYLGFCDLYKTSKEIKNCRIDISKAMKLYCNDLSGEAEQDCDLSIAN